MSTKTTPVPHANTAAAVDEAQATLDALEHERTWAIPRREHAIRHEQGEARQRGDADTFERLRQELFALARRNNEIIQVAKPAAMNALIEARKAHVTAQMALPTGTVEELEVALVAEQRAQRSLSDEYQQVETKLAGALRTGDPKAGTALLARKATLPFELAAADVRLRRAQAALLQAQITEADAELPALGEAVERADAVLAEATTSRNRAMAALQQRLADKREAESALRQHRRRFAADFGDGV